MTTLSFASYLSAAYSNCSIRERDGQAYFYQHAAYVPLRTLPHATRVSKNPNSKQSLGVAKRYAMHTDRTFLKDTLMAGSLKMNTALEYSTRVVQEGGHRCKKSTLNDLVHLTPLRIPLMNPP
jgi:hypothetical protein